MKNSISKKCSKCKRKKTVDSNFHKKGKKYQSKCKECVKAYHKKHYLKNKNKYKHQAKAKKKKLIKILWNLKDNPCVDCGNKFPPWVMQYDHIDSSNKDMAVGNLTNWGSEKRLREEIKKCELVCANCHADRTYLRAKGLL
jgi:hypothetical protein